MIRPRHLFAALALLAVVPAAAPAIDYSWTGNSPSNTATASWTFTNNYFLPSLAGGPSPGDRVAFDNLTTGNVNTVLDNNFSLTGLTVTGGVVSAAAAILVGPGSSAANTLTVLGEGINLSAANRSLAVSARVTVGAAQPWTVVTNQALTVSGVVTDAGFGLTLNNSATAGGSIVLSGSNAFSGAGAVVTLGNGLLRLDNVNALNGAAGLTLNPVAGGVGATASLFANGSFAAHPLTLTSTAAAQPSTLGGGFGTTTFGGPITLAGAGAAGVVSLTAGTAGTSFAVTGGVGGGYAGTLQLAGSSGGTGVLSTSGTASVALAATGTVRKVGDGLTWVISSTSTTANTWGTTAVDTGTLRLGSANVLPVAAAAVVGRAGTTGTLDLNGVNQQVAGLTTASSNASVNPAGNVVGLGNTAAGPLASTLTYNRTAGAETYDGTLVDSLVSISGYTLAFTLDAGDLTLRAANTYTGPTTINGTSVLGLATLVNAGANPFTNHGSVAGSSVVTLSSAGSGLTVLGLTGGANFSGGRFAPAANQTVRGLGTITGSVTVPGTAALRGGTSATPTGTLSVAGSLQFNGGGRYTVDLNGTTTTGTPAGRIAVTGGAGNVVDFVPGVGNPVVIPLLNDQNIPFGTPVSFTIGSATGGYRLNGATVPAGTSYTFPTDFTLTTLRPNFLFFQNVTLTPDGASPSNLVLSFTPVPEPATALGLAAAGLAAVRLGRRRILAG